MQEIALLSLPYIMLDWVLIKCSLCAAKLAFPGILEQQTNQPTSLSRYIRGCTICQLCCFWAHNSSLFFPTLSNPAHKDQITTDYYNIINRIIEKMGVDKTKTFRQICVSDTRKESDQELTMVPNQHLEINHPFSLGGVNWNTHMHLLNS